MYNGSLAVLKMYINSKELKKNKAVTEKRLRGENNEQVCDDRNRDTEYSYSAKY